MTTMAKGKRRKTRSNQADPRPPDNTPVNLDDPPLTCAEAARLLGLSPTTISRHIKWGIIPHTIRPDGRPAVMQSVVMDRLARMQEISNQIKRLPEERADELIGVSHAAMRVGHPPLHIRQLIFERQLQQYRRHDGLVCVRVEELELLFPQETDR